MPYPRIRTGRYAVSSRQFPDAVPAFSFRKDFTMASPAQCEANRVNAQANTGPSTAAGKSASSRNATEFGLFATNNCILPGEERDHAPYTKGNFWRLKSRILRFEISRKESECCDES
jgi:hypothetical protein